MLYEIGDPAAYVLPDVVCDFRDVTMTHAGPIACGSPARAAVRRRPTLKVSATWHDGYRMIGTVTIDGRRRGRTQAERAGKRFSRARAAILL